MNQHRRGSNVRPRKPYQGTQAVLRAISVMKVFTDEKPLWGLTELSKKLGLNKATAYRLLTALESERLISRDPVTETYTLGSEMIVMGGRALRSNSLRAISREELRILAEHTRESATLEVLSGRDVVVLEEIAGDHLLGGVPIIGTRWPAYATSTGKAILAFLPEEETAVYLKGSLPRITPKTITSPEALRRQFAEIRGKGYSVADEALELGFLAVGAPVFNHDGEVTAAISVGGPTLRLASRVEDTGVMVRKSAERISTKLGYRK